MLKYENIFGFFFSFFLIKKRTKKITTMEYAKNDFFGKSWRGREYSEFFI